MRNWNSCLGAGAALFASAMALAACSPAKEAEPKAQVNTDALPPAGQFDKADFSTQSWVTASLSKTDSKGAVLRVCHVSPAINEDLTLAIVVEESGATLVGAARVTRNGPAKPLGDVELQVDDGAAHVIHAGGMGSAALAVWPAGSAALADGPEAKAILEELQKGSAVKVKESGGATARSFPTEGLSQAIAKCHML